MGLIPGRQIIYRTRCGLLLILGLLIAGLLLVLGLALILRCRLLVLRSGLLILGSRLLILRLLRLLVLGLLLVLRLGCGLLLILRLALIASLLLGLTRRLEFEREIGIATVLGIRPPSGDGPLLSVDDAAATIMRRLVIRILLVLVTVRKQGTSEIVHLVSHNY